MEAIARPELRVPPAPQRAPSPGQADSKKYVRDSVLLVFVFLLFSFDLPSSLSIFFLLCWRWYCQLDMPIKTTLMMSFGMAFFH